jgi:hypothetical protein
MRILSGITGVIRDAINRPCGKNRRGSGDGMDAIEELKKNPEVQARWAEEHLNQLTDLQVNFDNFRKWYAKENDVLTTLADRIARDWERMSAQPVVHEYILR